MLLSLLKGFGFFGHPMWKYRRPNTNLSQRYRPNLVILEARTLLTTTGQSASLIGGAAADDLIQRVSTPIFSVDTDGPSILLSHSDSATLGSSEGAYSISVNGTLGASGGSAIVSGEANYSSGGSAYYHASDEFFVDATVDGTLQATYNIFYSELPDFSGGGVMGNAGGGVDVEDIDTGAGFTYESGSGTISVPVTAGDTISVGCSVVFQVISGPGDGPRSFSNSAAISFQFVPSTPILQGDTTTVTSSANPSAFGRPVNLTATITPNTPGGPTPTGTVTFMDGSSTLGAAMLDASGTATLMTSSLPVGTQTITANYSGDSNYIGSSDSVQQTVQLLPDIVMNSVSTKDSKSVTFNYAVENTDVAQLFDVAIYRAHTDQYNPNDPNFSSDYQKVDDTVLFGNQGNVGNHSPVTVPISGGLPPEPAYPYVLAVANPNGTIQESNSSNNTAYFRIYTVAFVVPGFGYTATESPPAWVNTMVSDLEKPANLVGTQNQGGAQYDLAIPFMWDSGLPLQPSTWNPKFLAQAEKALAQEVRDLASMFGSNAVLDVNLIGHSRGTEVIAGASQLLQQHPGPPQLQHGYLEVTLLDPHPANNIYFPNESADPGLGRIPLSRYVKAQKKLQDPPIKIPSNVNYVSEYYQHTPYDKALPGLGGERLLNLWGLAPAQISILDPQDTSFGNQQLIPPPVGHSEVPVWYTSNVVSKLYFGPA